MKYRYIVLGAILLVIIVFCVIKFFNRSTIVSNIKSMTFHYTRGYAINADIRYEINCENNKCIALYKPYGIDIDHAKKKTIDNKTMNKIEAILSKYEVGKWNGFHGNNKYVLDGDSFGLYITMNDDSKVEASGYMKWPKNYGNVRNELDSVFEEIFK